jgi:hypothetical protein
MMLKTKMHLLARKPKENPAVNQDKKPRKIVTKPKMKPVIIIVKL